MLLIIAILIAIIFKAVTLSWFCAFLIQFHLSLLVLIAYRFYR